MSGRAWGSLRDQIRAELEARPGQTAAQVAAAVGVKREHVYTVVDRLQVAGVKLDLKRRDSAAGPAPKHTPEDVERVLELKLAGRLGREIAAEVGLGRTLVHAILWRLVREGRLTEEQVRRQPAKPPAKVTRVPRPRAAPVLARSPRIILREDNAGTSPQQRPLDRSARLRAIAALAGSR